MVMEGAERETEGKRERERRKGSERERESLCVCVCVCQMDVAGILTQNSLFNIHPSNRP
jgi:hypothetical protein